jgi:zinc transport system ATP-binding protein
MLQLDIDNLGVRYGNELVLEGVSCCVHKGEFIGLIGPNGAGKTTLLRAILGLLKPVSGSVARKRTVLGYVPQRGGLYNGSVPISVLEVVMLGSRGVKQSAMQSLQSVHMEAFAKRRFTELSGGQQQRVSIAKALAAKADILILDEPAIGIDERSQAEFYALLSALHDSGTTIIMVSHEVDTVLKLVTRVICLNRTILYDGPAEHFEADKYLPQAYTQYHRQLHHHHGDDHA